MRAIRERAEVARSKTFKHGGSQAVRIPKDMRLPDGEVTVRRHGFGVLIEPADRPSLDELWRRLDELVTEDFMASGREQPLMPPPKVVFAN